MRSELYPSEVKAAVRKWYVIYLRPRSEKVASRYHEGQGYEVFLPLSRETRVWRNRQKRETEVPVFPNYLFIRAYAHELYALKTYRRIAGIVCQDKQPAFWAEREVESIRQMLRCGLELQVERQFYRGQHVRVRCGPLAGYEGILVRCRGKRRFGLHLKAINYTVLIDAERSELEIL